MWQPETAGAAPPLQTRIHLSHIRLINDIIFAGLWKRAIPQLGDTLALACPAPGPPCDPSTISMTLLPKQTSVNNNAAPTGPGEQRARKSLQHSRGFFCVFEANQRCADSSAAPKHCARRAPSGPRPSRHHRGRLAFSSSWCIMGQVTRLSGCQ